MTLVWLAPRVVTGACRHKVGRSLAGAVALGACVRPAFVDRIVTAHPGATYEATARGCDLNSRLQELQTGLHGR